MVAREPRPARVDGGEVVEAHALFRATRGQLLELVAVELEHELAGRKVDPEQVGRVGRSHEEQLVGEQRR